MEVMPTTITNCYRELLITDIYGCNPTVWLTRADLPVTPVKLRQLLELYDEYPAVSVTIKRDGSYIIWPETRKVRNA